jgi:uncharacterized membrane protein
VLATTITPDLIMIHLIFSTILKRHHEKGYDHSKTDDYEKEQNKKISKERYMLNNTLA